MAVLKVVEIMSDSNTSWEDAARNGIQKAAKTIKGIRSAWVQSQSVTINEKGEISGFRVNLKISFEVM